MDKLLIPKQNFFIHIKDHNGKTLEREITRVSQTKVRKVIINNIEGKNGMEIW